MASFATPLSGLKASSLALSVTANNLASLNTIAYKGMSPVFRDLFYQQVGTNGANDAIQVGVGAAVGAISSPFTQGSIDSTGIPTGVAIQGRGFFVIEKYGKQVFSRAGNFSIDSNSVMVNDDGGKVMGYPAVNGTISPSQTIGPLVVSGGQASPPKATSVLFLSANLDASAPVSKAAAGATPRPGNEPSFFRKIAPALRNLIGDQAEFVSPILLCASPSRFYLRRSLQPFLPKLVVLSPAKIPTLIAIQSIGVLHE
jgi:flagellar hook-basal body protein